MRNKRMNIIKGIGIFLVVFVVAGAVFYTASDKPANDSEEGTFWDSVDYESLDYSLVYDEEYYLSYNYDLAQVFAGKDSNAVFEHFLDYGMAEGRLASANFDVNYYREVNPDLVEQFADDYKKYFAHYVLFGHAEKRTASNSVGASIAYPLACLLTLNDEKTLSLEFTSGDMGTGTGYYIYELKVYEESYSDSQPVYHHRIR